MKFNKGLFDFIGYMSFFNPVGTGAAGDSKANREVLFDDVQECSSAEEFAEKHASGKQGEGLGMTTNRHSTPF